MKTHKISSWFLMGSVLCSTLIAASGFAEEAPAAPTVTLKKKRKKHKKHKRIVQNKTKAAPSSRSPASVSTGDEVQTFNESTSFEDLLSKQAMMARDPASFAPSARIIAVRREVGLTNAEAQEIPQDFILSGGTSNGIDEGLILTVARKIPILDPYKNNEQKELTVEFASIRVIQAASNIAVARLVKVKSANESAGVFNRGVLVGDYVGKN